MKITASLVLYNNSSEQFSEAISSFLNGCDGRMYVIDNSPQPLQSEYFSHPRVTYKFIGKNIGFGAAHNIAMVHAIPASDFHLLLNPDVSFDSDVIEVLVQTLIARPAGGLVMPRIEYPDGSLQMLCKLLPAPHHLFVRRFLGFVGIERYFNRHYELHDLPQNRISCVPSLSGCCLLLRTRLLRDIGLFDERYFMYMEDVDLVRRFGDVSETLYQPAVSVVHSYEKGSYKNSLLMRYHLMSALLYFFKWGWFYDEKRRNRNDDILRSIKFEIDF